MRKFFFAQKFLTTKNLGYPLKKIKKSEKVPFTRAFIIKKSMTSKMVLFLFCRKKTRKFLNYSD